MLEKIKNENILFLDIETIPSEKSFENLSEQYKKFWDKKSSHFRKEGETASDVYNRAGIYAEFGRIICISVCHITDNADKSLRVKSFYNDDEKVLLSEFAKMLNGYFFREEHLLCAHNGKEFDFPYIARRSIINSIKLPRILDIAGKKPWEIQHLDTMELWKFGDYKSYTSLDLLTTILGVPSPKNDIDGSQVAYVYWVENDLPRIVKYCEKDAIAVAQLFLKYKGEDIIDEGNITYI
jgi:3'-5' exonuclease